MKMRLWWLLMCLLASPVLRAADDFALDLRIQVPEGADLVRIELPEAVYRAAHRPDLGDLRIVNGAGEVLPMARLPQPTRQVIKRAGRTPVRLPVEPQAHNPALSVATRDGGQSVDIDIRPGGSAPPRLPGYLIDTDGFDAPIDAIELKWRGDPVFEAMLEVSASDDLKRWRQVNVSAPVLAMGEPGARVELTRVSLSGVKARYLRLTWAGTTPDVSIDQVDLISETDVAKPVEHSIELTGTVEGDHVLFVSPGVFPVSGIELLLGEDTHVLRATVSSRASPSAPWRPRGTRLAYKLKTDGGVTQSGIFAGLSARDTLWRLTVDGGVPATVPGLRLIWPAESIVFVARGQGPYRLRVGQRGMESAWRPPAALVPGYGTPAQVRLWPGVVVTPDMPIKGRPQSTSIADDPYQWLFWGVLALGVAVLGWMARSLLKELSAGGSDSDSR